MVNLAARIATHASAGELLVAEDVAERLSARGIPWEEAGQAALEGPAKPVPLARVPFD